MITILTQLIIKHCSPVLAGLKTANLFNYFTQEQNKVKEEIAALNSEINISDIYIDVLKENDKSMLIYIYRKSLLKKELKSVKIQNFLSEYGYTNYNVDSCLTLLKKRIEKSPCFPHEIGIFLGYPFEDVMGFIENKGLNFKLCGHWKVYCNEEYAKNCFIKYKKCTDNYTKQFISGKSIAELTALKHEICS